MPVISDDQLYSLLKENEFLDDKTLTSITQIAKEEKVPLYDAIVEKDLISDENLGKLIADYLKLPFINLNRTTIDQKLLLSLPEEIARRKKIIIFGKDAKGIQVATSHPEYKDTLQFISQKTGQPIHVYFATEKDISTTLRFYKQQLQETFDQLLKEQVMAAGTNKSSDVPVIKLVDLLIEYAYINRASDIHIEPRNTNSLTRFRIDGVLHDVLTVPKDLHNQIITRIKVLAKLRTDEHFSAQDGKLRIKLDEEDLDVRVSIVPVVEGEDAVLRLLSSKSRQFSLSDLGMSDKDLEKVIASYKKPYGMILVTGPTGSGKTTTIYAVLKILNTREKNIATIEDPVEYEIKGVNQIQVNIKTNLTFASGLRSILRQDPDIIFVGEIRDEETADIAINSALTGHLVLSTLHTNDAPTSVPRLIDMGVEPFLVSSTINVVIAQRLVRKICDSCKVSYTQTRQELTKHFRESAIKQHFGMAKEIRLYKGKGCSVCHNTGYIGRVGIFEILEVSQAIQSLIVEKANSDKIKEQAIKEGMTTMFDDGLDKVHQGSTTIDEVLRATKEQQLEEKETKNKEEEK